MPKNGKHKTKNAYVTLLSHQIVCWTRRKLWQSQLEGKFDGSAANRLIVTIARSLIAKTAQMLFPVVR